MAALALALLALFAGGPPAQAAGPGVVEPAAEPTVEPAVEPTVEPKPPTKAQIEARARRQARARAKARLAAKARIQRTQRARVVAFARRQIGKPYVWGGTGPRSFDCSGLMLAAYRSVGRTIPRTTSALLAGLRSPQKVRRGDLLFGLSHHVAMYIGHGRVIHAPAPGRRVEVAPAGWHSGYATRTVFSPLR